MGIDWCPFKPKAGVAHDELVELVTAQSRAFQSLDEFWSVDPSPMCRTEATARKGTPNGAARKTYLAASERLAGLIDFGGNQQHSDLTDSFRVYPITRTTIFPPQWRMRAHRTILPDELPGQLDRWMQWVNAVRQGRLRGYLMTLYLYETTMLLFAAWHELQQGLELTKVLTNKWAQKPEFRALRDEIASLDKPRIRAAPVHVPDPSTEQTLDASQTAEWRDAERRRVQISRLVRRWNRTAKKARCSQRSPVDFVMFIEQSRDSWLDEFFAWARAWELRGYGLYLHY
jgi:hypothetical protein